MSEVRTEIISFRISPDLLERLDVLAEQRGLARSTAVFEATREWIRRGFGEKEALVKTQRGLIVRIGYNADVDVDFVDARVIK